MKSTNITQTYEYNFAPISLISVRNSSGKRLDRNVIAGSKLKTNIKIIREWDDYLTVWEEWLLKSCLTQLASLFILKNENLRFGVSLKFKGGSFELKNCFFSREVLSGSEPEINVSTRPE